VRRRVFWDLYAEVADVLRVRPYYTETDSLAVALSIEEESS
jgi:hypothetical protein